MTTPERKPPASAHGRLEGGKARFRVHLSAVAWLISLAALSGAAQTTVQVQIRGSQIDIDVSGNLYVLNTERATVTVLDRKLTVRAETGGPGWEPGQFDRPAGIWARNGLDIFVADYGNHRIQRFDRALSFVSLLTTHESDKPEERFGYPTDVALSRIGELFICDSENHRIVKVNATNQVEKSFGDFGGGKGRLTSPSKLDIGPRDNLYVLDGSRIVVFDAFGNFLRELYQSIFDRPVSIFADADEVWVLDGQALYCFDREERPVGSLRLSEIRETGGRPLLTFAVSREVLYLLTEDSLVGLPNPFSAANSGRPSVDTEPKNR